MLLRHRLLQSTLATRPGPSTVCQLRYRGATNADKLWRIAAPAPVRLEAPAAVPRYLLHSCGPLTPRLLSITRSGVRRYMTFRASRPPHSELSHQVYSRWVGLQQYRLGPQNLYSAPLAPRLSSRAAASEGPSRYQGTGISPLDVEMSLVICCTGWLQFARHSLNIVDATDQRRL